MNELQLVDPNTGDWWLAYGGRSWTLVGGCTWPEGEMPPACEQCWARGMAKRFHKHMLEGVRTKPENLGLPLKTKKPTVFACQIQYGDLFHPEVPTEFLREAWGAMVWAKKHTFVVLTKRPSRALMFLEHVTESCEGIDALFRNVYLLASVWDQESTDAACAALSQLRLGIKWGLHCEPLLGPVDLSHWMYDNCSSCGKPHDDGECSNCEWGTWRQPTNCPSWIVVGGETGPKARPMHPDWVRAIRDQCQAAGVPFWFKSGGEWIQDTQMSTEQLREGIGLIHSRRVIQEPGVGPALYRFGKKKAGRRLDGRTWNEVPWGEHA